VSSLYCAYRRKSHKRHYDKFPEVKNKSKTAVSAKRQ
jgi:hypothetical protein